MRQLWAWLRMMKVKGEYPIDTSEQVYNDNLDKIDIALPLNGGKLQADGTWLQEPWKTDHAWGQSLPTIAKGAGQLYMPAVGNDRQGIMTVINDPALQETAADNLVALAMADRFDSPWDGIMLDLEGIPSSHSSQLSDFLYLLSYKVRSAGLPLGIGIRGRAGDSGPDYDQAYTYDFSVVAQVADYVIIGVYGYWNPPPQSLGPYWWINEAIQYSLSKGILAQRMILSLGNYSTLFPVSTGRKKFEITYARAIEEVQKINKEIEWIERNENGLVRERFSDTGKGHIWIQDGDTFRHGLDLVDEFGLFGVGIFAPGMGDPYLWEVVEDWRN